jgi:hypothetical protein
MTPLSQLSSHPALYLQDLRTLIEDIVYARALIATIGGDICEHDEPLQRALGDALAELNASCEEKQAWVDAALEAAWARIGDQLGNRPVTDTHHPAASAA